MAARPSQQQINSSKHGQIGRTPLDLSNPLLQQIQGKQVLPRQLKEREALGVELDREEDELLQEPHEPFSHAEAEMRREQEEVSPVPAQPQPESPFRNLHSQIDLQHPASGGQFMKDPETLLSSSIPAMPSNADISAYIDSTGSFGGFPSKQVEGALQSCLTSVEGQVTRLLQQAMDTVQSQVLRALHQAASDIIQHLGKEAAQRVVVAERKVALLELELSSVKQQALSMLLRLKADSDAQALDADKKYLLERRRAQDAEAKLAIAHDNSKRLKVELKRKGDIIDKMQKLMQPVNEYNSGNPSRSMEITGQLESCVRGNSNDGLRKSPICSVDGTSFIMCSTGAHYEELNCTENQLHVEANVQATDGCFEKQNSVSSKTPAAEEEPLGLQKQACSSNGTLQNSICSPNLPEEECLMRNSEKGKENLFCEAQVELSGHEVGSHKVDSLHANTEWDAKPIENIDDVQHVSVSESIDEKANPLLSEFEKPVAGNEANSRSIAAVKGFYVRRKMRDNVKMPEKKEPSMADDKRSVNAVVEHDLEGEGFTGPSNETKAQLEIDLLKQALQNVSSKRDPLVLMDATDSSSLLGNADLLAAERHGDLASDLPEEISSSDYAKAVDMGCIKTRGVVATKTVEFARPDYEVATSLAELASIGLDVRSQKTGPLPHIGTKEGIFLKPGRTGLRKKRKGVSFERKMKVHFEGRVNKKPRPEKLISSLTDSHAERVLRRNRGHKYSILKDSLSLEASRDNRRLMQGARQLLCLAEKKWR